jgi:hypothetical protein
MSDPKSKYNNFQNVWKSYQIIREGLIVPKDEIKELISYFEASEDYEICKILKGELK